jgi:hypothetical protein
MSVSDGARRVSTLHRAVRSTLLGSMSTWTGEIRRRPARMWGSSGRVVIGLAVARRLALQGARSVPDRSGALRRLPHQLAELGGHPRRHSLSAGLAEGAVLRERPGGALRVLRRARRGPPADGQAGGGHPRGGASGAGARPQQRGGERGGAGLARRRRGPRARARGVRGAWLWSPLTGIVDSHSFMSALREDAERAGAMVVLGTPVLSGRVTTAEWSCPSGETSPPGSASAWWSTAPALGSRCRPPPGGLPAGHHPAAALRQGPLLRALRRLPFRHLVYRCRCRAGWGRTSPSISTAARASVPTSSGWTRWTTRSTSRERTASTRPSAATGPGCRTGRSSPGTPESAPR